MILIQEQYKDVLGYSEFLNFVNTKIKVPTSVLPVMNTVNAFINSLLATIVHKDYLCYCVELYKTEKDYAGFLVVDDDRLFIFLNGKPYGFNFTKMEVATLFEVVDNLKDSGLFKFYSNTISLKSCEDTNKDLTLSIYRHIYYGTERFHVEVKKASEIVAIGTIQGLTVLDSVISCYTIKVDKLSVEYIEVRAALNQLSKFKVVVSPELSIEYFTTTVGEVVKIPKSESSLKRIKQLVRQKIIFADI